MKRVSALSTLVLLGLSGLFAQPYPRTFVASSGADTPTCGQRSTPCASFEQAALNTSVGGELDALDTGDFGGMVIGQSITIDGGPGVASITRLSGIGCTGAITAAVCILPQPGAAIVLRNLTISMGSYNANYTGIAINTFFGASASVNIENVQVVAPTGYCVLNYNTALVIRDSNLRVCGASGVYASGSFPVTIENVVISNSLIGLNVTTGSGGFLGSNANVVLRNSNVSQNSLGISVISGVVTVDSSLVSKNATGISATTGGVAQISNATVTGNGTGLSAASGGAIVSFVNNRIYGNTTNGAPTSSVFQK